MNRCAYALAALVVVTTAAATTVDAGPQAETRTETRMSLPAPEHARLAEMCGTWDVEITFWLKPGAPGLSSKGTSTIRSLLNGLFVEEKIEGTLNGAPFTTLAWTGFNTSTRQYEATRIASTNTIRIAESGSYDDKTRQFELKADYPLAGDTWHQRTVIQQPSADSMIATSYLSFGNIPEWKSVEIKYTRTSKSPSYPVDRRLRRSISSSDFGQSSRNRRDSPRSASSRPPV